MENRKFLIVVREGGIGNMASRFSFNQLIVVFILPLLSSTACARSMIAGRVVDAQTGNPIVNAAVFISWEKSEIGPPGLTSYEQVEVAEDLSDGKGYFKIPKYSTLFKHYRMAVYKKGYVCWNNEKVFPTYEERKDFSLQDGMVIKLRKFQKEYSKKAHANFTLSASVGRKMPGLFDDAIKPEKDIERSILRRERRE